MKLADITQKNEAELAELITAQRTKLSEAVLESRTKEIRNVKTQYAIKRTIARVLTVQRQRQIGQLETKEEQTS
jgi:ribosomal protein L29